MNRMASMSEARQRANKKWNDAHMKDKYDRIQLVVPKGEREVIKGRAADLGKSVNGYIMGLVDDDLNRAGVKPPPGGEFGGGSERSGYS